MAPDSEYKLCTGLDTLQAQECDSVVTVHVSDDISGSSVNVSVASGEYRSTCDITNTENMNDHKDNVVPQHNNGLFNNSNIGESDSEEDIIDTSHTLNIDEPNGIEMYGFSENRNSKTRNNVTKDIFETTYTLNIHELNGREMPGLSEKRESETRNDLMEDIIDASYTLNINQPNARRIHSLSENGESKTRNVQTEDIIDVNYTLSINKPNGREIHGLSENRESETRIDLMEDIIDTSYSLNIDIGENIGNLESSNSSEHLLDISEKIGNQGSSNLEHSLVNIEMIGNLGSCELKHSLDISEEIGNKESSDLKHSLDSSEKIGKRGLSDLEHSLVISQEIGNKGSSDVKHSLDISEEIGYQGSSDLKNSLSISEKIGNLGSSDLEHSLDIIEKIGNLGSSDLEHSLDIIEKIGNLGSSDLEHSLDIIEKIGNLGSSDLEHSLDIIETMGNLFHPMSDETTDDSCDSQHSYSSNYSSPYASDYVSDFSSEEEEQSNPDLADVFNKLHEVYAEFNGENLCEQLPSDFSERVTAVVSHFLKWFNGVNSDDCEQPQGVESVLNQDADCEAKFDVGGIIKDLLEIFTRENESAESMDRQDANYEATSKFNVGGIIKDLLVIFTRENGSAETMDHQDANYEATSKFDVGGIIKGLLEIFTTEDGSAETMDRQNVNEATSKFDTGGIVKDFLDIFTREDRSAESIDHQNANYEATSKFVVGSIVKDLLETFTRENWSAETVDHQNVIEATSKLDIGGIVKDFLEIFTRENGSAESMDYQDANYEATSKFDVGGIVKDLLKNAYCEAISKFHVGIVNGLLELCTTDVICDLVHFWGLIDAGEDNAASMVNIKDELRDINGTKAANSSDPKAGNTDSKTDTTAGIYPLTNLTGVVKHFGTEQLKIFLWMCSGGKVVAADSYRADGVLFCCDGANSVNDFVSALSLLDNGECTKQETSQCEYMILSRIFVCLLQICIQAVHLTKRDTSPKNPASSFKHWVNDNSCQLTNIELTDNGAKTPIEVIVSFLTNWDYSSMSNGKYDSDLDIFGKSICRFFTIAVSLVLLFFSRYVFPLDIMKGLEIIAKISPHCEYFLRNLIRIFITWLLYIFFEKLLIAQENCMFGNRLVKEVCVLELLCSILDHSQPKPSEKTELQKIVKKLNEDFQVENISSRFKPGGFQDEFTVVTQAEPDSECGGVVHLLWSSFQDTLSQLNWCNAFADVTKLIYKSVDDIRKSAFPEADEVDVLPCERFMWLNLVLSGSRLDGCVSLLTGPGNACDLDVMAPVLRSDYFTMECVPNSPINIVFKEHPGSDGRFNELCENRYVSQEKCKLFFPFFPSYAAFLISSFVISPLQRQLNSAFSLQLGDVASTYLLFQGEHVIFSIDYVPAVVIDSWPDQALSWISRSTDWPARDIREAIAGSGCHAVAKTPKGLDPHKVWRLSFSKAENTLCKIFTPCQAFHLSLFKTQFQSVKSKVGSTVVRVFKNYNITKGEFHTYHAKTTMFWFCENHPPKHKIWRKENVFQCQSELLESMEGMMRDGSIPHYFIPEQNILEGIPVDLVQQAIDELSILKEEARTESGRVYQEIIKQRHKKDSFSQYLSDLWCLWTSIPA